MDSITHPPGHHNANFGGMEQHHILLNKILSKRVSTDTGEAWLTRQHLGENGIETSGCTGGIRALELARKG